MRSSVLPFLLLTACAGANESAEHPLALRSATGFLQAETNDSAVLVFRSRSLFKEWITPKFPRIVFARGQTVFTMLGNPEAPEEARETVESMPFADGAFGFHTLRFRSDADPEQDGIVDKCDECHGGMPVWANYSLWSGNAGAFQDQAKFYDAASETEIALPQESHLFDLCKRVVEGTKDDELERYRAVLDVSGDAARCVASYLAGEPNANLNRLLDALRIKKVAADIAPLAAAPALEALVGGMSARAFDGDNWKAFVSATFRARHEQIHGAALRKRVGAGDGDLLERILADTRANLVAEHTDRVEAFATDNPALADSIRAAYQPLKGSAVRPDHNQALFAFTLESVHFVALLRYLLEPCLEVDRWAASRAPRQTSYAFFAHPTRQPADLLLRALFQKERAPRRGRDFASESARALDSITDVCRR